MEKNEIKKLLYKQNPDAELVMIRKGVAHYNATVDKDGWGENVFFQVPVADMGDADFYATMSAKLLIRYLGS